MRFRLTAALWVSAIVAFACLPRPAVADESLARPLTSSIVTPANSTLRDIMAQAVPVGTPERPLSSPGLPTGLTYTLDVSAAFPYGNTGSNSNLPGGVDAVLGYGVNKHFRLQAGYYDFQEYPVAFNSGVVPVYLQGFGPPIGSQDLSRVPNDVAVKNKIITASVQGLFLIAKKLPVIITPTYLARRGTIGGHSDEQLTEINGFPQQIRVRTVEQYILPVTLPFLSTPRMFGTLTAGPQWNVNLNGANAVGNHAQIFELAYLEYRASKQTTFFFQPSRLIDYLPPDPYPQFIPTIIYGVSHKFTKNTFVQIVASTGAPSNRRKLGITSITCQQISPGGSCGNPAPTIEGLHAAQVQLQFGIGSPSVIPL
ncbi:MAG: hypothetical protein NVSMB64_20600 [Candidatus Velthaea sp.]